MADLVTHLCTALLPGSLLGAPRATWLALGAVLPDLASRVPGLLLDLVRSAGVDLPAYLHAPLSVLHMPIGVLCGGVLLGPLVHPTQRAQAVRWLIAGGMLHLAVDALQDHHGLGYFLFFPLNTGRYELGWIGSEATVAWAPWLALLTAVARGIRLLWLRRRSKPS